VLKPALEEDRAPAPAVVAAQFEVVALACYSRDDMADPGPRVEPLVEEPQLGLARWHEREFD
jgi:hypothetical protein